MLTRDQALERAAELNREHPDRVRFRWLAREGADGWEVARIVLPSGVRLDPLGTVSEARPRPPQADDPRPAFWRNVGGPWAGS